MYRDSTCRKTKNCYVIRIASKGGNVFPDPLKCGNLVHIGVAAFEFFRMFFAQCRKRKMTEASKSVVNSCQDHAMFGKGISCRAGAGAATPCEAASMNPNHHWQF